MPELFKAILNPMLMLFICIVIGFLLKKAKILPDNASTVISKIETFVLCPAMSFSSFSKYCTIESLKENYTLLFYSIGACIFALILANLIGRFFEKTDEYKRNVYKYALTIGNIGFMGIPLVSMVLGEYYVFLYQFFNLPLTFTIYLWGYTILTPKEKRKKSPIKNLFNPGLIAIFVGMITGLTGLGQILPTFVVNTVTSLSNAMAPLAMILTGFVVGGYPFKDLFCNVKVYIATFLRLVVIPIIIVALLYLCKASTTCLIMALFAYATPLGLNTVVFPASFGAETKTGASMAIISHTLSVVTIPLMYSLLNFIF